MKALDKKLWRELWQIRMQVVAIAMVIIGGVGIFIMSLSTLDSLYQSRETYYRNYHFADVFASLKRAPLSLATRIADIPGVAKIETRVVSYVTIEVDGFDDPISGHLISLPDNSGPNNSRGLLNQIYLTEGHLLTPGTDNEVIISQEFAQAHQLKMGDKLRITINGRRKNITVVGMAQSPEYIYQIAPGELFPDFKRYSVMWMAQKSLASAYDMDGAFNNVTLTLNTGAIAQTVIDRLDSLLKPYGGIGAYARKDQLSNRFLTEELRQLETMATVFPVIFLGVAAFLLNVVISRLISLQREQIASLKGFGYSNVAIGFHYGKLVLLITGIGVIGGIGVGIWMGKGMSNIYQDFYSLPFLIYILRPSIIISAALISILSALVGTVYAVANAAKLAPAEAMRPEPPTTFRATLLERMGLQKRFSQPTRMILRHIERRPVRSLLTTLGIAMACGTMMIGGFQRGAIEHMVNVQFSVSQREDMQVNFHEPTALRSLYSLQNIQGVEYAEGFRNVPAKLQFEHRSYRTALQGIQADSQLMRLLDSDIKIFEVPENGVVITDYLAELLHIQNGDILSIEVLEGRRPTLQVPVLATTKQYLGVNVYMRRDNLNRLLDEDRMISGALIAVGENDRSAVYSKLKDMPRVAGVVERQSSIQAFYETLAETVLFFTLISTLLGGSIAFGVVYNCMRITLSERNRELASLRVLGFERSEVAYILLGEMFLLTLIAIPFGLLLGYGLCAYLSSQFATDLYRIPLIINNNTFAFAASVVIVSSLLSALMIWNKLANLDMVATLKTKE